ncbi:MAG: DUF2007 domain-containing protein [Planctomycetaceae bacterium]|jgi:hypothetical protein|nr:DUF2007 domain-containing protein [Planctomycetaceae bacterium]MDG2388747.1 DUF2007 domain-containing protein [Planctomycetaceae bacterium]
MPVVYSAGHPAEAHLCRQYLEAHGIEARVDGEILWQARGDLPPNESTNPTVLVSDENIERARALVVEFESSHAAGRELDSWSCSQCAEDNPSSFDVCWNCGATAAPQNQEDVS